MEGEGPMWGPTTTLTTRTVGKRKKMECKPNQNLEKVHSMVAMVIYRPDKEGGR